MFDAIFGKMGNDPLKQKQEAQARFNQLKQKATVSVEEVGLNKQKARVALALDASGSMSDLYRRGTMRRVCEQLLALAIKFDDNGAVDVFLFDDRDREIGEFYEHNFYEFTTQDLNKSFGRMGGGTAYAGVIRRISRKYFETPGDPAYVLFITDGDNTDKIEAEKELLKASHYPIFWQFVGIGNNNFAFLEKLDTLQGRFIDNANFFSLDDLDTIAEESLYKRMLQEFPHWLKTAKEKNLF